VSNALAIATVTTALAQVVRTAAQSVVAGADVLTERPPATPGSEPRVRLFLYQAAPNPALRNEDLPLRSPDGSLAKRPTVALDLHFLLAFYGSETELEPQRMLGAVVRDLREKPVLTRQMIADAVASQVFLDGSDLADATEQVKFTPLGLALEELSKLWSVLFQTPYALSVAYRGTVVLIESEETGRPAPPVLRRGEEDRGVEALLGGFPALDGIHIGVPEEADRSPPPPSYPGARLGSVLTLSGRNLSGDSARVRFTHPRLAGPVEIRVAVEEHSATRLRVSIPEGAAADTAWAAGLYAVEVIVTQGGVERATNRLALPLAPRIDSIAPPNPVVRDGSGSASLTIGCRPQVLPEQAALLQIAAREIRAEPHPVAAASLDFVIEDAPVVTEALVRVRVDGVDSLPFVRRAVPPPPRLVFDDAQKVTIQ
jgi:hypothetical protein